MRNWGARVVGALIGWSMGLASFGVSHAQDASGDWLTYQHDAARSGAASSGSYDPARMHELWQSSALDGLVYAQPLVSGSSVYVVTNNNTVYALDGASGGQIWSQHLGDPVTRGTLPCGDVDPTGILSTPVIDPGSGTLYAVDYLPTPQPHHEVVALDLASGAVRFAAPIDPPAGNVLAHQQRAALLLLGGTLYVPFGGLFGDCGDYHGWLLGVSPSDGSSRGAYQVPTQREGAIWGAPSANANNDIFVSTGNGSATSDYDGSNAVVRLSADLQAQDFFAPSDWAQLSRRDTDLGSTGPTVLDAGQVLQIGKSGVGYLLGGGQLGQIGGEQFQAQVCSGAYGEAGHAGATAYYPCRDGLAAVQVQADGQSFSVPWHGPRFTAGPPLITDSAVWTLDTGSATLYGLSRQDGSVLFTSPVSSGNKPPPFIGPSAAGGRIFHSLGMQIVAFGSS
jgi:outer membrane protein assembly factor BamB